MISSDYIIETENLIIRESDIEDCVYFMDFERDPEIYEHFSMCNNRTLEDVKKDYTYLKEGGEGPILLYTILDKKSKSPIGRFIAPIDYRRNHTHIDWLYIGDESKRNNGYGTEALNGFLDFAFNTLKLERVGIDFFSSNTRVESLYKRNGFTREGVLRHYTKKNDKYIDLVFMSILSKEYFHR